MEINGMNHETWDARDYREVTGPSGDMSQLEIGFHVTTDPCSFDGYTLDIFQRESSREGPVLAVCEKITMRSHVLGERRPEPLQLSRKSAQALVDQLCSLGVRPSSAPDIQIGEKQAMEEHIKDLRSAVDDLRQDRGFCQELVLEARQYESMCADADHHVGSARTNKTGE